MVKNIPTTELERELRRVLYETGIATSNTADLVPVSPEEALAAYLDANPEENLPSTMRAHASRLTHFIQWCRDTAGITNINELSSADLENFKRYQAEQGYAPRTLETQFDTLRVFLRFCRRQDYVISELPYLVPEIEVSDADGTRDRVVDHDRAMTIIGYLATFRYATREHLVWLLLAENGLRTCTLVALDLDDYIGPTDTEDGYLDLRHRPETGTRLKNGAKSEREVALSPSLCDVLDDYVAYQRIDAVDEHGREPLLTTVNGRIAAPTIRTYVNKWTAPCHLDGICPHGREPETCIAAQQVGNMDCPSKRSPHDVRRGYITHLRQQGVPREIIADEVDASVAVLDHHYDKTTKADQRRMRAAAIKAVVDASKRL